MGQQAFDFEAEREAARERSIDERFKEFAQQHPDVLSMFRGFASDLRNAGHKRIGAKLIWERIRWERLTSAHGAVMPSLNNDFTSRMSRWLVTVDPSFDGYFETRQIKSDSITHIDV